MGRNWKHTVKLADVWRDEDREFTERRDEIVKRIRALPMFETDDDLQLLVDDLREAEDIVEFDYTWNEFYNWADDNDVWVATF